MNRFVSVTTALLIAAILSGCFSSPEDPSSEQAASAPVPSAEPPAEESVTAANETPAPNTAPTANLTANVSAGQVPFNVSFDISGADEDGDNLSWSLDADGDGIEDANGSSLPESYVYMYGKEGNFTATLNVTDGEAFALASVNITATAPAAPVKPKEDAWARWDANGVCHAKGAVGAGPLWWHDRPAPGQPQGTGFVTGGGTWIYEESNGMPGLQVGGTGESAAYQDCKKPDTLIF